VVLESIAPKLLLNLRLVLDIARGQARW
jgi:hypothetical protein